MARRVFSSKCSNCGKRAVSLTSIPYSIDIRHDARDYKVDMPLLSVPRCSECGNIVFDDEANRQVDRAFREQAGLLTPEQIRANRHKLGLTQKEMADWLAIGQATLSRWETGAQIQQRAMDILLRGFFFVPEMQEAVKSSQGVLSGISSRHACTLLTPPLPHSAETEFQSGGAAGTVKTRN